MNGAGTLLVYSRDRERFARKVQRASDDGCWAWAGARNARGYGVTPGNIGHIVTRRAWKELA